MRLIRVSINDELLAAVDAVAETGHETRSAFIRAALQTEVKRRQNVALEEQHKQSYQAQPDDDAWQPGQRAWGE